MAAKPFFSGRIPQDLYNRVEEHLKTTGVSKTEVLIAALATYLDLPVQLSRSTNPLEARVTEIEQRLEALDSLSKDVASLKALTLSAITTDNKPDNTTSSEQLTFLETTDNIDNDFDNTNNNEIDNVDNIDNSDNKADEAEADTDSNVKDWEVLGEMHIPEIISLPDFKHLNEDEIKKLKNKLRNLKGNKDSQLTTVGSYQCEIVGKEPGAKGQIIYRVSRKP